MHNLPAFSRRAWLFLLAACIYSCHVTCGNAQDSEEPNSTAASDLNQTPKQDVAPSSNGNAQDPMTQDQAMIAQRFKKLEEVLLRSSELEAVENPTRAALLRQAVQLGKQAQLSTLMTEAADSLERRQFSEAIQRQKATSASLQRLLELLQSENREERVREQRDQVRRWIEETDRLLRLQGALRGRTEGGQQVQQAADDQSKLASKAGEIIKDLGGDSDSSKERSPNESDSSEEKPPSDQSSGSDPKETSKSDENPNNSESQQGESQQGESQQGESQQGESQQGESQQGESQQGESQQGESQQGESQQGESQQGESQQGQQPPQAPQSPTERAQQRIQQAQQKMKEAEEALENAQREGAIEKQREAEENLREAIEELEEILRQLREEEIERSLASLETRLRRMLEMQLKILEESERLNEIAGEGKSRQVEIRASNLSLEERKILGEGERAYLLLREEGSSAAFPEAVEQLNTDIGSVIELLAKADVGPLTLIIEQEIVSSLEEMIEALVQVQKENKEQKQQQQQSMMPQQGQQGDKPLVNKLAEIRLIRTLQLRINKRTDALGKMLQDPDDIVGQVQDVEILDQLKKLSERQSSIQSVTRDIVVGKGE